MIQRTMTNELLAAAQEFPVVTVFGPRQSGKTTLFKRSFLKRPIAPWRIRIDV